jgi:hypothetical protein
MRAVFLSILSLIRFSSALSVAAVSVLSTVSFGCASSAPSVADSGTHGEAGAALVAPPPRRDDAGAPLARFVTTVVKFTPGDCAGFGATWMPDVVFGPPQGGGERMGSLDVVSLGEGGEIVLGFAPRAIIDGPGPDFVVFENAFWVAGDPSAPFAEPGEVSVSEDGVMWKTWPCTAAAPPYGACSGWKPVLSSPENGISPFDVARAGGEAYDLADVGLSRARFVRVRDVGKVKCPADPSQKTTNVGYDLDAIAIVNAE